MNNILLFVFVYVNFCFVSWFLSNWATKGSKEFDSEESRIFACRLGSAIWPIIWTMVIVVLFWTFVKYLVKMFKGDKE